MSRRHTNERAGKQAVAAMHGRAPSLLNCAWSLGTAVIDPVLGAAAWFSRPLAPLLRYKHADSERRRRRGLIVVLGGIEGPSVVNQIMIGGLLRGRWRGAIVVHHWNRGIMPLRNLMSRRRHETASDDVAEILKAYRLAQPEGRIGVIAISGGCWIAVRALEKVDPSLGVEAAVLLAPAISTGADLSRASAACKRGIYTLRGPGDAFFLGLGTLLAGTSDRRHSVSGGWYGWRHECAGVHDMIWQPEWAQLGYVGNHITTVSPAFLAEVIALIFRAP